MQNKIVYLIIGLIILYFFFNKSSETLQNENNNIIYKTPSCGIANNDNNCYSCDDVKNAYMNAGKIYDLSLFEQCQ